VSGLDIFRLDGLVVVVTGASSGLGAEFARTFADAGADLVLAARRTPGLEATAADVRARGHSALTVQSDVTKRDDVGEVVRRTMERFGRLDVLINNAGIGSARPALIESEQEFRSVMEVNLFGAYWMAQACAQVMEPGSAIVNVSSVLALTTAGLPQAAYTSSKAGLLGLTRDLAQQWGPRRGIRVNAIAPGFFESEMTAQYTADYLVALAPRMLLGRVGDPKELAATVLWLASPAAGYVTGQSIVVDGGLAIT
jgi:NAD(P)-dependent dehydrogenase (short-subunit alcohol dehydrogenase family)